MASFLGALLHLFC